MPLSAFVIIVAYLCGSMKELHNISDVKEVLVSTTLELLVGYQPDLSGEVVFAT